MNNPITTPHTTNKEANLTTQQPGISALCCWREDLIGSWSCEAVSTLSPATYAVELAPEPVVVVVPVRRKRKGDGLREWACAVRARDGACCRCGSTVGLAAHHKKPKSTHPELALDLENGETLCGEHHRLEHPDLPSLLFRGYAWH